MTPNHVTYANFLYNVKLLIQAGFLIQARCPVGNEILRQDILRTLAAIAAATACCYS